MIFIKWIIINPYIFISNKKTFPTSCINLAVFLSVYQSRIFYSPKILILGMADYIQKEHIFYENYKQIWKRIYFLCEKAREHCIVFLPTPTSNSEFCTDFDISSWKTLSLLYTSTVLIQKSKKANNSIEVLVVWGNCLYLF